MKRLILANIVVTVFLLGCTNHKRPEPAPLTECEVLNATYAGTVNAIVQQNCATPGCHVTNGAAPGDFTNFAGLKAKVNDGTFKRTVLDEKRMPPSPPGPLSETQMKTLQCWLDAGSPNN